METFLIAIIVAIAVWYLYRHFARVFKSDDVHCGCGECENCSAKPFEDHKNN